MIKVWMYSDLFKEYLLIIFFKNRNIVPATIRKGTNPVVITGGIDGNTVSASGMNSLIRINRIVKANDA